MGEYFKILYTTYYQRVYKCCLFILNNPALAEDAAQDAFLKAYENLSELRDLSKFGAWVASIATKNAINLYNRNKRSLPLDNETIFHRIDKVSLSNDPQDIAVYNETSEELQRVIAQLNPPMNQLILLKYYWDLKDQEIAELLGIPLGTVKSSLHRDRKSVV